jgi:hypothetical protein
MTVWVPLFAKSGICDSIDSRGAMTPDQTHGLYILAGIVAFAFLFRRREAIAHAIRGIILATACACLAFILLWKGGLTPLTAYISALVVVVLIRRAQPRRSRYISARTKRQAVAEFEKRTGKSFNRRIHEFDHVLPHSRGGGNAGDNIQVLAKKKNRSKGAKLRWKDDEDC